MTKQRIGRRTKKHPGVRLMALQGRHVARWTDPGTRTQKQASMDALGLTTQAQREQWAVRKSQEIVEAKRAWSLGTAAPNILTIADAVANYATAKPVAAATLRNRRPALQQLETYCRERGIRTVDQLTAPRLWPWRDLLVGNKRLATTSKNMRMAVVSAFLRWLSSRDLVPLLPVGKIANLCQQLEEPAERIDFLLPAELRRLLDVALAQDQEATARPRWAARVRRVAPVLLLLVTSGMRLQEALDLDWCEVDLEAGEIRLPAARTKTRAARTITSTEAPTMAELLRALHRQAGGPAAGRVLVPAWRPQRWRIEEQRLRVAIGRHWSAHTLRKTCGTILSNAPGIYAGASAWLSAKRLGHSVVLSEKWYAGACPGLPEAAKTLEAAAGIEDVARRIVAAVAGES